MKRTTVVMLLLMAFFICTSSVFSAEVVKFGVTEIQSGAFKPVGDRQIWGIETAVKETNDAGGLLGKRIELVIEDNQMNPEMAVQKVEKLILQDGCDVIIQGSSSKIGLAIAQIMPRYKKIWLDIGAMAMAITGEKFTPYTFRTCPNAAMLAKSLAQHFSKKKDKKFFLINQDYSWGRDITKYFEKFINELAPEAQIVGKEFHKVFNEDFGPYIGKIQTSDADYVITGNWGADLSELIAQSRASGMNLPFGGTFLDDDFVMSEVGEEAIGCVTASQFILGVDNPRARALEESFYKNSGGKQMAFSSMMAFIGTKMFIEAVKTAGTFETEAVIKAFEGLTWEGPAGTITMRSQDHQAQFPMVLGEVVESTKYFSFPYAKPIAIIPAEQVSMSPEESGWNP
jgi:branched-chain amino acid transport system substrate-binding protein